ncbi:hypothetical protein GCM10010270_74130 [Streptomyces violaceus]|nr:hypothetical protein GCM10010270_74130 [Streptomyces janthinus]
MRWPAYLRGVLAFSVIGVLFLYLLMRIQGVLPGSLGFAATDPDQAFNTAASSVTNTDWQSYYGEQAMGHVVQTAGLAVQNFVSAAVGIAVAVVRGFALGQQGYSLDYFQPRPANGLGTNSINTQYKLTR